MILHSRVAACEQSHVTLHKRLNNEKNSFTHTTQIRPQSHSRFISAQRAAAVTHKNKTRKNPQKVARSSLTSVLCLFSR